MDDSRGHARGTSLEGTSEIGFQLAKEINGIEGVAEIIPSIGVIGPGAGSSTHIHFLCLALPIGERKNTQAQMIREMRRRLAAHPAWRPSITARNALGSGEGSGGYAISANLLGPDLDQLADFSLKALAATQKLPSIGEVKISLSVSNPEIHVLVDRKRAADLGVRMATVGNTLRLAVAGDDQISNFREGAERYPVKVRVLENQRRDIEQIGRLTVPSADRAGPHRQHREDRARPRPERAAALEPPVHGADERRRRRRGTRSTRRRTTSARCSPG